jgi:hypothetical protein
LQGNGAVDPTRPFGLSRRCGSTLLASRFGHDDFVVSLNYL